MRIGILDAVPKRFWHVDHGITDAEKFTQLLQPWCKSGELASYYVAEGQWPSAVSACDAYLVTGSPCSVNSDLAWIPPLIDFVHEIDASQKKLVGVCFGHQLIAKAFGGEVKSAKIGWLMGLQEFEIIRQRVWMMPGLGQLKSRLYFMNQDQVMHLPDKATKIATSVKCENTAFVIGDHIVCLQGHPEQRQHSMQNFINSLRGSEDDKHLDQAIASMTTLKPDREIWGQWISHFFYC